MRNLYRALVVALIVVAFVMPIRKADFPTAPSNAVKVDKVTPMLKANHCWGNDGKDHGIPGHVVVIRSGKPVLGGVALTGTMLDALFGKGEMPKGVRLVAFCR